jgi:ankyrin repeat protein
LACLNNRTRNIEVILRHESNSDSGPSVSSLEKLNRLGLTPLHIASQEGYTDVVKVLLKSGADAEKTTPATSDKLSPLMIASQFGHLSIVKLLFECGVNVEATDKRHRTALTHAVMNGHSHIVSYLLRLGANPNTKDSSGNSLVHYASAYGWYYCFKLLIEAKAKPNDPNDWKMSPLCIAFMKGHTGLAEEIIKEPGVNINIPVNDSNGEH